MTTVTLSPRNSISNNGILKASRESIELANCTSESDSACDEFNDPSREVSPSKSDSACNESFEEDSQPHRPLKKSVRFSLVQTREYGVVDERGSRSLGWDYVERESDLEAHLDEIDKRQEDHHLWLIQEHIRRAEREREERERAKRMRKRKRFGSKLFKPMWKGLLDSRHRSATVMSAYV